MDLKESVISKATALIFTLYENEMKMKYRNINDILIHKQKVYFGSRIDSVT